MKGFHIKYRAVFFIACFCFSSIAWGQIRKTASITSDFVRMADTGQNGNAMSSPTLLTPVAYRVPLTSDYGATLRGSAQIQAENANAYAQEAAKEAQKAALIRMYSRDNWRVVNGTTNFVRGPGWIQFEGRIVVVKDDGVIFSGYWGPVLQLNYTESPRLFYVRNFPYKDQWNETTGYTFTANDGSIATVEKLACNAGYYEYPQSPNRTVLITAFDYGIPCVKYWSPEELAAMKERIEGPKREAKAKALKFNQEQADKGDQNGLLRMGERYRDGDGVPKDLSKAREYLQKAADAGSSMATNELSNLDQMDQKTTAGN